MIYPGELDLRVLFIYIEILGMKLSLFATEFKADSEVPYLITVAKYVPTIFCRSPWHSRREPPLRTLL